MIHGARIMAAHSPTLEYSICVHVWLVDRFLRCRFARSTGYNKTTMARGHQKAQSQAKTLEKTAKAKKQQGHSANDQKKAAQKALVHACVICKVSVVLVV